MLLDTDSEELLLETTESTRDLRAAMRETDAAVRHQTSGTDVAAPGGTSVDLPAAELAMAQFLRALGRDPADPHLADTPRRVAAAFDELLTPRPSSWTTFPNTDGYADLVLVRDIPFHSLCAHHLLPFRGTAHIGYIPSERLFGLSKLARGLEMFARDLQIQERLTKQVADWLQSALAPRGVGVVLEAEHLCMSLRGVAARGATTRTSTFYGELGSEGPLRAQFSTRFS